MSADLHILMVAAENDALRGGKVGGIGDVVRDAPPALADESCKVTVVVPSYGFLHLGQGGRRMGSVAFLFGHYQREVEIYEARGRQPHENVAQLVLHHPDFESYDAANGAHRIYVNDPGGSPFQSDAAKYALFCAAVAEALSRGLFGEIDVLHLHDWHAAFVAVLRAYHEKYRSLRDIHTVYTIHNLAYQGIRPLRGVSSSLEAWYPGMAYDPAGVVDPRYPDCINPMAAGIRLCDSVHTVSPSYAREILRPSDQEGKGYYGGEGLEDDLRAVSDRGRLFGILNGCDYPPDRPEPECDFDDLVRLFKESVLGWAGSQRVLSASHFIAHTRLAELEASGRRPDTLLTSVSRVNSQKMRLLMEPGSAVDSALQGILEGLGEDGLYVMLGTGDPHYENFFTRMSSRYDNFIFLNGFSNACASALYGCGDLFLMPSSYEPCGISQMLAMRDGQPCLAHGVGGLKDTIRDGVDGFSFEGDTIREQVDGFVAAFQRAMEIKRGNATEWRRICREAYHARFLWKDSVTQYIEKLYAGVSV